MVNHNIVCFHAFFPEKYNNKKELFKKIFLKDIDQKTNS